MSMITEHDRLRFDPPKSQLFVQPHPGTTWGMLGALAKGHWRYRNAGMSEVSEEAAKFINDFYEEFKKCPERCE